MLYSVLWGFFLGFLNSISGYFKEFYNVLGVL